MHEFLDRSTQKRPTLTTGKQKEGRRRIYKETQKLTQIKDTEAHTGKGVFSSRQLERA